MRDALGLDIIAAMRSRFIRLALATATVCTVAACQTPASEGATKAAPAEVKPLDAVTPGADVKPAAGTATTVTAPGSAGDPTITASAGETPTTGVATAGSAGTADPVGTASTSGAAESAGPPDTAGAAATAGTPPADPAATVEGAQNNLHIDLVVTSSIPGAVLKQRLRLLAGSAWELRDVKAA